MEQSPPGTFLGLRANVTMHVDRPRQRSLFSGIAHKDKRYGEGQLGLEFPGPSGNAARP
jgi:hypothetical protein